jgi:hypothetical protein
MAQNTPGEGQLTERQKKWFASVRAGLERDTGKTLEEWAAIARTCSETTTRARVDWLRANYGLGVNRAAQIFSEAFPSSMSWDEPKKMRAALWTHPDSTAILRAVEAAVAQLPDVVGGQRKGFTAFSRKVQFAAVKPVKGGTAVLGLAVSPDTDARLQAPRNEGWSDRLKAKLPLASPVDVDERVKALLQAGWERS